jgi:4-alpha-glucanotransferase
MADRRQNAFASGRHAGIVVPLFSIPSRTSWGIGEIPDLPLLARWLESAGLDFVQLLPVNEMQEGQSSPYSALSAMAIDPIFIAIGQVEEFRDAGGELSLSPKDRRSIDGARASSFVDYTAVRAVKASAFRRAFGEFLARHWSTASTRARQFRDFTERERWWLKDYALFRALHDENRGCYWLKWEPGLRSREPAALAAAGERLSRSILYYQYLQWLADDQWRLARRACGSTGIFGDFPFIVSGHSADVWARQDEFRVDASVGVPPDAFSETGQDWGLPVYRWDVIEESGDEWLRQRAARCAALYDGFRIDHLVGFYRTFVREPDGRTYFVPESESAQLAQGERLLKTFATVGSRIIAEDLGTVPDFVRESLARFRLPGLKVFRWEREWNEEGQPFRDPAQYPADSVATSGTHDTETLAEWWDGAGRDERQAVIASPGLCDAGIAADEPYGDHVRDVLLEMLFASASDLVLIPMQDVFGWRERINTPASHNDRNWTWRLPWPVEDLTMLPAPVERARFLRHLTQRHRRTAV